MMNNIVPPICFVLALAMLITAFGMYAVGVPDEPLALHEARVLGDESYESVLEEQLESSRRSRRWLMVALFAGSAGMLVLAFLSMRPAERLQQPGKR